MAIYSDIFVIGAVYDDEWGEMVMCTPILAGSG